MKVKIALQGFTPAGAMVVLAVSETYEEFAHKEVCAFQEALENMLVKQNTNDFEALYCADQYTVFQPKAFANFIVARSDKS